MPSADENYELKEQLGQGTFGSVYKAYVVSEAQCQKRNLAALTSFLLFFSQKLYLNLVTCKIYSCRGACLRNRGSAKKLRHRQQR